MNALVALRIAYDNPGTKLARARTWTKGFALEWRPSHEYWELVPTSSSSQPYPLPGASLFDDWQVVSFDELFTPETEA